MLKNTISKFFGIIFRLNFPKPIQKFINEWYVNYFKIDMSNFKHPSEYESLLALFTRRFECEIDIEDGMVSPCDGEVFECGKSEKIGNKNHAFSIKGSEYFIDDVLLDTPFLEFDYLNIYLSPKDYHNYHAPLDMSVKSLKYIPANLHSVSKKTLFKIENLYAKNERVILECQSDEKTFFMVFVGAFNVGKMVFDFDKSVQTNMHSGAFFNTYDDIFLKKGELFGRFELGSTILIFSKSGEFEYCVKTGDNLKVGKKIAL